MATTNFQRKKIALPKVYLDDLVKQLHTIFGNSLQQIWLYGSYARGDFRANSDVDIMVIANKTTEELRIFHDALGTMVYELIIAHDYYSSIQMETRERFQAYLKQIPYFENIANEGIILYEKISN